VLPHHAAWPPWAAGTEALHPFITHHTHTEFGLEVKEGGLLGLFNGTGAALPHMGDPYTLPRGVWCHLTLVASSENCSLVVYRDGDVVAAASSPAVQVSGAADVCLAPPHAYIHTYIHT
jgi:hypothetical protein